MHVFTTETKKITDEFKIIPTKLHGLDWFLITRHGRVVSEAPSTGGCITKIQELMNKGV